MAAEHRPDVADDARAIVVGGHHDGAREVGFDGDAVEVQLAGGPEPLGVRWEGEGLIVELDGEGGRRVRWTPSSPDAQIRAGARSRGGVSVVARRARDFSA